jgi:membrane protein implicated in regulation of membrane protease activity
VCVALAAPAIGNWLWGSTDKGLLVGFIILGVVVLWMIRNFIRVPSEDEEEKEKKKTVRPAPEISRCLYEAWRVGEIVQL